MITLNSKLEKILMSLFGKKIVLEMQEHILEKTIYCHSDQLYVRR